MIARQEANKNTTILLSLGEIKQRITMDEQPLMSRPQQGHLQICNESDEGTLSIDESFRTPLSAADSPEVDDAVEAAPLLDEVSREERSEAEGATVFQTSLNVAKMCCGTGTLALPFAAEKGGILFNLIGLFFIGLWNYYSANCLLRCLEYLPDGAHSKDDVGLEGERSNGRQPAYGTVDSEKEPTTNLIRPPPDGTTTYGRVAWYASGPKGRCHFVYLLLAHGYVNAERTHQNTWMHS